ncbi:elongation factor G, partial [bacterium]|nr:elongation factor G [bacterium]
GKTTVTERVLFYTGITRKMGEVHDGEATMDFMKQEQERGITIASAAISCRWRDHRINIIDTPGHVDFTIEVERALRVLDGAVLVLCAVAGVQSQTMTVDRQMKRYKVPRVAFVNKCDRSGANPRRVTDQLREKLHHNAVMMQMPLGLEQNHEGVIDLVRLQACRFTGEMGEELVWGDIPERYRLEAETLREELIDAASMFSDELMEAALEGEVDQRLIHDAVRRGTLARELTPVFMGSAYKNKGVQLLLEAVTRYLPDPTEVENDAHRVDRDGTQEVFTVKVSDEEPLLALTFKLEDGAYGQLTYIRLYQGTLTKGDTIHNTRTGKRVKVGRLVQMHADQMLDIVKANAGDIVALFGIDCASGDTFSGGDQVSMTSMHVPEPVVSLAVVPLDVKSQDNLAKALGRFTKEDPTFRTRKDEETGDTLIMGMGELHLEVYLERIRREYHAVVEAGRPKVSYRECITRQVPFDYTHRKQSGGSGQYARIKGYLDPSDDGEFHFENRVAGGNVPTEFIPAVEKGFRSMIEKGAYVGYPVQGLKVVLEDGASHAVDSSDQAFQAAARGCFRENYGKGRPIALEPLMLVSVEGPTEFQGDILGTVMQRRGIVIGTTEDEGFVRIDAHVPLAEMFGYATVLRSSTQGKAEYTMEFARYSPAPAEVSAQLVEEFAEQKAARHK